MIYTGEKLKELRKRARLTQEQVMELTGIAYGTIYHMERGTRKPHTSTLEKLLTLYAIRIKRVEKIEEIFSSTPPPRPIRVASYSRMSK